MAFERECGPCAGHGYYAFDRKETCTVCKGAGVVTLGGEANDYKTCGPCSGLGYYGFERKDTCTVCRGLGVLQLSSRIPGRPSAMPDRQAALGGPRKVFLVHGHNTAVRDQIDLFLTKDLRLPVRVMAAEPHIGRTLPEKFEEIAIDCSFAVFLLTADDMLQTSAGTSVLRARQNVILEVGYFWGALGRRRMALLVERGVEFPSDIQGLGWIEITPSLADAKLALRQELEQAGLIDQTPSGLAT